MPSFYVFWLLLALLQANYTELLSDEAYYWKYSQFLDWGYFDHPPMVALLIKIGSNILPGEIGVRLLFTLMGTGTIFLLQQLVNPSNKILFYVIISSIGLLYFMSFLALPDIPLIFFSSAFFYLLKQYYRNDSLRISILIGIIIACILLSKYHGFVVITLAFLSNLKLIKKRSFFIIFLVSLALVLPHFLWQVYHNFPSIQYHFHDRNLDPYHYSNTINFILAQLILFGPLIGFFLWIGFFKSQRRNQLEKTLYWQIIGVLIFFFLLTFNGEVQGHWTSILIIPLIYFGYLFLNENKQFRKWAYYQWPLSVLLIFVLKLGLVTELPVKKINALFKDFKTKEEWAQSIHSTINDRPLVFMNSYQNASIYEFYTGQKAITISNVMSRKNQYDLWHSEDSLRGETVAIIPNYPIKGFDTLPNVNPFSQYTIVNNFQHYGQVDIMVRNWKKSIPLTDSIEVNIELGKYNNFDFLENQDYPSYISYTFFEDNHFILQKKTNLKLSSIKNGAATISLALPRKKSTYQVYFSIQTGWLPPSLNSKVYELEIS